MSYIYNVYLAKTKKVITITMSATRFHRIPNVTVDYVNRAHQLQSSTDSKCLLFNVALKKGSVKFSIST